jgi:fatty acid/phospholipid biosynthesis enzyme
MRVIVELDNAAKAQSVTSAPASSGKALDGALLEQFASIQRKLMGLLESQQSRDSQFLDSLKEQQMSLLSAMEQLVGKVQGSGSSDAILEAVQGMKKATTVKMPNELLERFDSMESAIVNGMRRSRNRTFGSNY